MAVKEQERAIDGAALVGMARLGIGEFDVLGDVLRRELNLPGTAGDGQGTVAVDGGDVPSVSVLHHQPAVGAQLTVVPPGRDQVAHMQSVPAGDHRGTGSCRSLQCLRPAV